METLGRFKLKTNTRPGMGGDWRKRPDFSVVIVACLHVYDVTRFTALSAPPSHPWTPSCFHIFKFYFNCMSLQRHKCTCVCVPMRPKESVGPRKAGVKGVRASRPRVPEQVLCKSSNRFLLLSSIYSPISPCLGLMCKPVKLVASQHIAKAAFAPPGGSECPHRTWHAARLS